MGEDYQLYISIEFFNDTKEAKNRGYAITVHVMSRYQKVI